MYKSSGTVVLFGDRLAITFFLYHLFLFFGRGIRRRLGKDLGAQLFFLSFVDHIVVRLSLSRVFWVSMLATMPVALRGEALYHRTRSLCGWMDVYTCVDGSAVSRTGKTRRDLGSKHDLYMSILVAAGLFFSLQSATLLQPSPGRKPEPAVMCNN
ncbi:hypothetical protein B0I35DRAFT_31120 [Stachybotrys elegans]|uniref:Uncharacterized protein n=1 Tax=Stachybotrys elegans TaxID=80388 RepID=A0A8K0WYI5_9HYPO|nr:hypothetical protein B0I35DRAFT_31120 [Stachybotrys elegans]